VQVALTDFAEANIKAEDTEDDMVKKVLDKYGSHLPKDKALELLAKDLGITADHFIWYLQKIKQKKIKEQIIAKQKVKNRKKNKEARKARRVNKK